MLSWNCNRILKILITSISEKVFSRSLGRVYLFRCIYVSTLMESDLGKWCIPYMTMSNNITG